MKASFWNRKSVATFALAAFAASAAYTAQSLYFSLTSPQASDMTRRAPASAPAEIDPNDPNLSLKSMGLIEGNEVMILKEGNVPDEGRIHSVDYANGRVKLSPFGSWLSFADIYVKAKKPVDGIYNSESKDVERQEVIRIVGPNEMKMGGKILTVYQNPNSGKGFARVQYSTPGQRDRVEIEPTDQLIRKMPSVFYDENDIANDTGNVVAGRKVRLRVADHVRKRPAGAVGTVIAVYENGHTGRAFVHSAFSKEDGGNWVDPIENVDLLGFVKRSPEQIQRAKDEAEEEAEAKKLRREQKSKSSRSALGMINNRDGQKPVSEEAYASGSESAQEPRARKAL